MHEGSFFIRRRLYHSVAKDSNELPDRIKKLQLPPASGILKLHDRRDKCRSRTMGWIC